PNQALLVLALIILGLFVIALIRTAARHVIKRNPPRDWQGLKRHGRHDLLPPPGKDAIPAARPDLVIACSGGGIKSASFCLGALQHLGQAGIYPRADAVVGVSGGGYAAAAYAVAHQKAVRDARRTQEVRACTGSATAESGSAAVGNTGPTAGNGTRASLGS